MIDAPCRLCSHSKSAHSLVLDPAVNASTTVYCVGCYNSLGEDSCFHDFELDNLKYLELCVEQKEEHA